MHDVFISYSSKDINTAELISRTLEAGNIRCWYAPRDIAPGLDWREAIISAISTAKVFILVYSHHSNSSRQVLNEVTAAFNASCVIIPFRIEDDEMAPALSYYLSNVHWMDALTLPRNSKVDELCHMVKGILGERSDVSEKPVPAPAPKNRRLMPIVLAAAVAVCVLIFCVFAFGNTKDTVAFPDDPAAIEEAYDSTVVIYSYYQGDLIYGTCGFACFDDDIIVTVNCLPDAYIAELLDSNISNFGKNQDLQISVSTASGVTFLVTEILVHDSDQGIAILSTSGSHGLPLLQAGSSDDLRRGDKLTALSPHLAIGEYLGYEALGESEYFAANDFIAFSELLEVGSSGSALLDPDGNVIGMTHIQTDLFSYAIPIERIQALWDQCRD